MSREGSWSAQEICPCSPASSYNEQCLFQSDIWNKNTNKFTCHNIRIDKLTNQQPCMLYNEGFRKKGC